MKHVSSILVALILPTALMWSCAVGTDTDVLGENVGGGGGEGGSMGPGATNGPAGPGSVGASSGSGGSTSSSGGSGSSASSGGSGASSSSSSGGAASSSSSSGGGNCAPDICFQMCAMQFMCGVCENGACVCKPIQVCFDAGP